MFRNKILWIIYTVLLISIPTGLGIFYWHILQHPAIPNEPVLTNLSPEKQPAANTAQYFNTAQLDPDQQPNNQPTSDLHGKLRQTAQKLVSKLFPENCSIYMPNNAVIINSPQHATIITHVVIPPNTSRPERKFTLHVPIYYTPHGHCEAQMPLLK